MRIEPVDVEKKAAKFILLAKKNIAILISLGLVSFFFIKILFL
ncbi:hypothetical protein CLV32_0353 [Pedobacter duraquae]|uniref:Uncharacterized protein n=1 Tax=Pedobacter duraquae TaxID=425511 RepID=A0A4R6IPX8_9SPHI|nr:hypothetical protein CLV32_0353 [Pedobacter duraquae]